MDPDAPNGDAERVGWTFRLAEFRRSGKLSFSDSFFVFCSFSSQYSLKNGTSLLLGDALLCTESVILIIYNCAFPSIDYSFYGWWTKYKCKYSLAQESWLYQVWLIREVDDKHVTVNLYTKYDETTRFCDPDCANYVRLRDILKRWVEELTTA